MFYEKIKRDSLHQTSLSGTLKTRQKCIPSFRFQGNFFEDFASTGDRTLHKALQNVIKNVRIYKWKNLKSLQIQSNMPLVTRKTCFALNALFKDRFSLTLKTLNLSFKHLEFRRLEGLFALSYGIGRYLRDLEELSLSFEASILRDYDGLLELVKQIGLYCHNLKKFSFDLSLIQHLQVGDPKNFQLLIARIARYFSKVEKLSIDRKNATVRSTEYVINTIVSQRIGRLRSVKTFSMNFEQNFDGRYEHLQQILQYLCGLKRNIQSVSLNFSHNAIASKNIKDGILKISEDRYTVKSLVLKKNEEQRVSKNNIKDFTLLLNFNTFFDDQGMEDLILDLVENLGGNGLESLKLGFVNCKKLTINAFEILCWNVSENFTGLRSLDLNFHGCFIIDKILQIIIENLRDCIGRLAKLALKFFECKNITGEGLRRFGQLFEKSGKNLEEVSLTFDCGSIVDPIDLEDFGFKIRSGLVGLNFIMLRFVNCPLCFDESVKERFCANFDKVQKKFIKWEYNYHELELN